MSPVAVFLFSLIFLLHLLHQVTPDPPPEKEKKLTLLDNESKALLAFMKPLKHDTSYNWKESEPTCSWKGVFCDPTNTTVIQLSLPAASLIGTLTPNTIGNLSNLLYLSLRNNNLSGNIPPDFCNLPLNQLYLQDNKFSGHLWNINADDLEDLNVSNNAFECWLPGRLFKFPNTSFLGNPDLCSFPFRDLGFPSYNQPDCNFTRIIRGCFAQPSCARVDVNSSKNKRKAVGISAGLGLLLLIFLFYIRKKIYLRRSKQLPKPSLEVQVRADKETERVRNNDKFVFFDGFDLDKLLLQPPVELLGNGSVGTTYKQVLEDTKTTVVVKRLEDVVVSKAEFESHMEVLGKMKSEYVVPLIACYYLDDEKWLVYDYMNAGSLSAHLHGSIGLNDTGLKWDHRKRIALSAARGIAYLHDNHVIHGNIKSSNILLLQEPNKDFVAKLSDYGLNTLFEVAETQDFSFKSKSDVYFFGVLLLELLTGKAPNQASVDWNELSMWVQSVVCEEPKVEIFDVELTRDQNIKEMFQMLRIAKDCVLIVQDQRPTMQKVVSMMKEINPVEIDDWLRQSSDHEASKGYDDTPSTMFTRDTPSTVTP